MEVLYIIKSSSADICSGTPCNKASNEDLCRYDAPVQCTMQQGLTFEKKVITKCSTLKIDFSANFHLTHDETQSSKILNVIAPNALGA